MSFWIRDPVVLRFLEAAAPNDGEGEVDPTKLAEAGEAMRTKLMRLVEQARARDAELEFDDTELKLKCTQVIEMAAKLSIPGHERLRINLDIQNTLRRISCILLNIGAEDEDEQEEDLPPPPPKAAKQKKEKPPRVKLMWSDADTDSSAAGSTASTPAAETPPAPSPSGSHIGASGSGSHIGASPAAPGSSGNVDHTSPRSPRPVLQRYLSATQVHNSTLTPLASTSGTGGGGGPRLNKQSSVKGIWPPPSPGSTVASASAQQAPAPHPPASVSPRAQSINWPPSSADASGSSTRNTSKDPVDTALLHNVAFANYARVAEVIRSLGTPNAKYPKDIDLDYSTLRTQLDGVVGGLPSIIGNMKKEKILDYVGAMLQDSTVITLVTDFLAAATPKGVSYEQIVARLRADGSNHTRATSEMSQ